MKKTAMLIGLAAVLGFSSNAQAVDWNWKGDLRYRYQSQLKDTNTTTSDYSRDRHRIRFRMGADMWINEELSSGFEIRTGDSATSGNETLDTQFSGKTISLSEAYIDYHPMVLDGDVNILLGKRYAKETLVVVDDLVWDGDVTLEGMTLQYGKDAKGKEKDGLAAAVGCYIYDEMDTTASQADAYIVAGSLAYKGEASGLKYQAGANYFDYVHVLDIYANTDYDILEFFGNVGGKVSSLPWKVYGQFATNLAENSAYSAIQDNRRDAYLVGVKLGKAKKPGQLEGAAEYYHIEEDAVNSHMTDQDRGDELTAHTNIEGFKVGAKYALIQNMTLGVTYYNAQYIKPATLSVADDTQHLLQLDAVVKF